MKIILVEANKKIREKWAQAFSELGFSCHTHDRAYEAVVDCESDDDDKTDILVLGLDLPIMNGRAYVQAQINSFRFFTKPLVLVIPSSLTCSDFKTAALNQYLVNSEDLSCLVGKVNQIFNSKHPSNFSSSSNSDQNSLQ